MALIVDPPSLSEDEFKRSCQAFVDKCGNVGLEQCDWLEAVFVDGEYVKIVKSLPSLEAVREKSSEEFLVESDSDEGELRVSRPQDQACVEYSIVLSPTYRVPVIYFSFRNVPIDKSRNIDTVYTYLVPSSFREGVRSVGVMGGLSMQNHPMSDKPSFFLHPCNTPTMMEPLSTSHQLNTENYLLVWMGMMGSCVGLDVPLALLGQINAADEKSPQKSAGGTETTG